MFEKSFDIEHQGRYEMINIKCEKCFKKGEVSNRKRTIFNLAAAPVKWNTQNKRKKNNTLQTVQDYSFVYNTLLIKVYF